MKLGLVNMAEVCRGCRVHGHCRKRERLGHLLPNLSQLFA